MEWVRASKTAFPKWVSRRGWGGYESRLSLCPQGGPQTGEWGGASYWTVLDQAEVLPDSKPSERIATARGSKSKVRSSNRA